MSKELMKEVKVCAIQTKPEIQKFLSCIFFSLSFFIYTRFVVNATYECDERFSNVYTIIIRCSNRRIFFKKEIFS